MSQTTMCKVPSAKHYGYNDWPRKEANEWAAISRAMIKLKMPIIIS